MKKLNLIILLLISFYMLLAQPAKSQDSTGEGTTVLDKIKEKVQSIRSNPKAYIGTVTDKTESSLQIENPQGQIEQIAIKSEVKIVRTGKTDTEVKFSDVAIGDFIAALGITNGSGILDAKRILLIPPPEEPKRKMFFAEITNVLKKEIKVREKDGTEYSLIFPKSWKGPDLDEMEAGMTVSAVTVETDGKLQVRTIEIIKINLSPTPVNDREVETQ